jgi:hypothetical protein
LLLFNQPLFMFNIIKNTKKTSTKYFGSLVVTLLLVITLPQKSYAFFAPWDVIKSALDGSLGERICSPTNAIFKDIAIDQPQQSIVRFGYNYDTVRFLKIFYNIFGVSIDNAIRCTINKAPFAGTLGNAACTVVTGASLDPAVCNNFILSYNGEQKNYALGGGNGSLLSFYYTLDSTLRNIGNPLDLNYFAQRSFNKVPFVGRALAQGANFTTPLVDEVYFAWVIVRNLALGVFAILMLVVGAMMINRTRLSAQAVVTIQYSLPKIIIAIILIVFSYPIGALITTATYYLAQGLIQLVIAQGFDTFLQELGANYVSSAGQLNIGLIIGHLALSVLSVFSVGIFIYIVVFILSIIMLIQQIMIFVKAAITYVKMIMEIVLSPVSFVYSAIPGNDAVITGWFKKMLAYALSFCALSALPPLVIWIALSIMVNMAPTTALGFVGSILTGGAAMGVLAGAVVSYVGFSMTLKLPAQIEETLTGKKKGR